MEADLFYTFRNIAVFFATAMLFKYYVFLMISPWYVVKNAWHRLKFVEHYAKKLKDRPYLPLVSVVIPAWNEEVGVIKTIKSVLDSTYHKVEIVVINDGSNDRTHAVARRFILNLHKYQNEARAQMSISYARQNRGGEGCRLKQRYKKV